MRILRNYLDFAESTFCFASYISYLPLAHIYERANQIVLAYHGAAVGFYQGVQKSIHLCIYLCLFSPVRARRQIHIFCMKLCTNYRSCGGCFFVCLKMVWTFGSFLAKGVETCIIDVVYAPYVLNSIQDSWFWANRHRFAFGVVVLMIELIVVYSHWSQVSIWFVTSCYSCQL